jgi:DNA polymerase III subunit gamma/tau
VSLALYRRYRPDSFEEVVGQEHVTLPLQQALRNGRINHAYLFSGPRGCGKTTSARILARCLNCEQGPTPTPCGVCQSCADLANGGGGSIDVIEIDAASHGGVDDARDLRERAFFAPASSRFKIYIIDEAHMVTSAGFNALLKVVEEPPPHLKFIFATTEPEKVIGTIRSRTHHYPFRLIPPATLRDHLADITAREGIKVEPEVLPLVVRAGAGSARDAMSVLDQLLAGADENGVTYAMATGLLGYTDAALLDQLIDAFAARDGAAVFGLVDQVVESGHDPRRFLADLLERFRDLVILNAVAEPSTARGLIDVPEDQFERMLAQAGSLGPAELSRAADLVNTGLTEMRGATAPRLLLELVCARVMLPGADDSERGLLARIDRVERRAAAGPMAVGEPAAMPMHQMQAPPGQHSAAQHSAAQYPAAQYQEEVVPQRQAPAGPPASAAPPAAPSLGTPPWQTGQAAPANPQTQSSGGPGGAPPWAAQQAEPQQSQPSAPVVPQQQEQEQPVAPSQPAPRAPAQPSSGGAFDQARVRQMWPDLLEEVKRKHGRVSWMLLSQNAQVVGVDDGRLQVAFTSAGARDSFKNRNTGDALKQAVQDLFGVSWQIEALVDPSQTPGTQVAPGVVMTQSPAAMQQAQAQQQQTASAPQSQGSQNQGQGPSDPPPWATDAPSSTPSAPAARQQQASAPTPSAAKAPPPQAPPAYTPPPTPSVAPEHDTISEDDEDAADNNTSAHDLVMRELNAQVLDSGES